MGRITSGAFLTEYVAAVTVAVLIAAVTVAVAVFQLDAVEDDAIFHHLGDRDRGFEKNTQ